MEWSKIDKDWKKQMDERTIAPSSAAWDKLAQQLDKREKKGIKLAFQKWMGIAACLLIGGILGLVFWITAPFLSSPSTEESLPTHYVVTDQVDQTNAQEQQDSLQPAEYIVPKPAQQQDKVGTTTQFLQLAQIEPIAPKTIDAKRETMDSLVIDEIVVKNAQRKVVVDSNDLLKQVEGEIEVEYRETKLKKIIDTTRKTVVDLSESIYEK
ncbi:MULTISPECIES: hypothetical protein [unclassified Myroides]|uniref:hypothetical protein n=1 Tax=unclassified Myroides TaxID=2642485 RepID=UPI0015FB721E|nr:MULTISPECIES: hypothetical protein [unclassified Myroides]MBB1151061.1 hypothetical protein [Myroides sp. NP-2]MDM1407874.1 hypothetical protein [Myroides sp. DF42-4-2]